MGTKSSSFCGTHWLLWTVLLFFAVAIPYAALDQRGGSVSETVGVIESFGVVGKYSSVIAAVRLKDGSLVQAEVVPGATPLKGYIAYMRVYNRSFSNTKAYEIYRADSP